MMKPRFFYLRPIRQAMKSRGLVTQRDLAAAIGVTQPTISRLFSHRSCREETALKICEALGLKINKIRDVSADLKQAQLPFSKGGA